MWDFVRAIDCLEISCVVHKACLANDFLGLLPLQLSLFLPTKDALVAKEVAFLVSQEKVLFVLRDHLVKALAELDGGEAALRLGNLLFE
mmetsp:Transcript_895/g.1359  ORF Transcript_895/g.1359 Transcript_895/m.1359 type:complete len:89 (-) Transcript_895:1327-1593(-)